MTEIVVLFAEKWHTTPFEILKQDIDDFILVANHIIELGRNSSEYEKPKPKKEQRIRVNDKTATGGWF